MNSIKPLATVVILAVIGVGLYMVINTSEPIPPEEAASVMLEIPQIEEELANLIDEGAALNDEASAVPPFVQGSELTAPPAWSPPPAENSPADSTTEGGSNASAQPPQDAAATPSPPTESTLPTYGTELSQDGAKNPFSTQIERQVQVATTPQEVKNPYASDPPGNEPAPGDIPRASAVEELATAPRPSSAPPNATASTPFSVARNAIDQTLRQGNLSQALLMLSQYCGDTQLTASETAEVDMLLSQLAGTVIYSTEHELEPPYRVQPGETLEDVAARFQVTPQLLAKINGLTDLTNVSPGTELKVVRGPFHAVYDSEGLRLVLDGRYAGRFEAAGGGSWPADSWTVQQKIPGHSAPDSLTSAGKQILLSPATPSPGAQGAAILSGAPVPGQTSPTVYVAEQGMEDLYDILTVGSRVTIRR